MRIGDKMKKLVKNTLELIKEEYKFLFFLILLYFILQFPLNYYIITGGGTSDVSSRIEVDNSYKSKGSFNISYVTELPGTVMTYLLSYIVPNWERESADLYKYSKEESTNDIKFRNELDLKTASSQATYWAYTLANKKLEKTKSELYVITIFDGYETPLKVGDKIKNIDNHSYETVEEYRNYIQTRNEDDEVTIEIERQKKSKEIKTKVYSYKDRLILGVGLQFLNEYETKPKLNINFKSRESGPSGGLITTLEIYNQLTKKDITKGLKIAGTGTIEENGDIGEIGGIEHKILGAESDKIDIFLVPSGNNYKDAKKYKETKKLKIKLIEVKNIQDALEKLEKVKGKK